MVGNIGALRTPPAAPVDRAVEYALALISGWTDKKREPFKTALEDLRESAKHNAEVYEQASAALHELSALDKEVRDLAVETQHTHDTAVALKRQVETEAAGVRAALAAEQATHRDEVNSFHQSADARHRDLVKRETAASARYRRVGEGEVALAQRVREVTAREIKAAVLRDRYNTKTAQITAIINRKD